MSVRLTKRKLANKVDDTDDDMFELLKEWKLINTTDEFREITKSKQGRDQLYGYIESHGGARKMRQSIRPTKQAPPKPSVVSSLLFMIQ